MDRYICVECGKEFDLDSVKKYVETHGFTNGPVEEFTCCPYCGGDYEEADICERCGKAFFHEDYALFADRWCASCLREMITLENFIEFLKDDAKLLEDYEIGCLEQFYFNKIWGLDYDIIPKRSSLELKRDLFDLVSLNAKFDKMPCSTIKGEFLEKCRDFIMEDRDCAIFFAEWLSKIGGDVR